MIIPTELFFNCSLVILSHGTSSHVMPVVVASSHVMPMVEASSHVMAVVVASSHVMPAWACAMAGIYGCGHFFQSFCLETMDSAAIETSKLSSEFEY